MDPSSSETKSQVQVALAFIVGMRLTKEELKTLRYEITKLTYDSTGNSQDHISTEKL
jgi:hypothetical protein